MPKLIALASMALLGILVLFIWEGLLTKSFSLDEFLVARKYLALLVVGYAIICAWRLIKKVTAAPAPANGNSLPLMWELPANPAALPENFVRDELIFYSIFWIMAPPIWFFVEYFAVESDWLSGLPAKQSRISETPLKLMRRLRLQDLGWRAGATVRSDHLEEAMGKRVLASQMELALCRSH